MEINVATAVFQVPTFGLPWCCWFTMVKPGEASTIHPKPRAPHEAGAEYDAEADAMGDPQVGR